MTQKIDTYFGLNTSIEDVIDINIYRDLSLLLQNEINKLNIPESKNAEIFIIKVIIKKKDKLFGFSPLSSRLAKAEFSLEVGNNEKEKDLINFFTPLLYSIKVNNEFEVKSHKYRVVYSIPGNYFDQNDDFSEYVAVIVLPECRQLQKKVNTKITAFATETYKKRLYDFRGSATTRGSFRLTKNVQLHLNLNI